MNPKFLLGGALLVMAVVLVIAGGFAGGAQYFLTIGELRAKGAEFQDLNVRISTEFCGVRSVCWCTSVPFRLTLTLATPLLEVTTAATTLASSVTRDLSSG